MSKSFFHAALTATVSALMVSLAGAVRAQKPSVEIIASPLRPVAVHEADDLTGRYHMSDGRRMRLTYRPRSIVANLDGEPVTQLRAVSSRELRSADGRVKMRFEVDSWRGRTDVTVTLLKGETLAQLTNAAIKR